MIQLPDEICNKCKGTGHFGSPYSESPWYAPCKECEGFGKVPNPNFNEEAYKKYINWLSK